MQHKYTHTHTHTHIAHNVHDIQGMLCNQLTDEFWKFVLKCFYKDRRERESEIKSERKGLFSE